MDAKSTRTLRQLAAMKQYRDQQKRTARDTYDASPKICSTCHSPIPLKENQRPSQLRNRRYCSRSCAAKWNNHLHPKRRKTRRCRICRIPVLRTRWYCSNDCKTIARSNRPEQPKSISSGAYVVTWRQRTKQRAITYMGGKCVVCGYDRCPRALTFHHLEPSNKDFVISSVTRAWDKIKIELDKCVLLCANCHAEVHDGLITLRKLPTGDSNSERHR